MISVSANLFGRQKILSMKLFLRYGRKLVKERVILGLSGGVDSSVLAALLHQAIGEQLTCIFVDTGLLRLNETQEVQAVFCCA